MTAADMPFEADPQLTAAVEDALAPVTADPSQAGTNVLDTTLHFRDLTAALIARGHDVAVYALPSEHGEPGGGVFVQQSEQDVLGFECGVMHR